MLFSGLPFLYYFLPLTLLVYFLVPRKLKNTTLLLGSLVFYGWGEPKYLLLMLVSILTGYIFACVIETEVRQKVRKLWLTLALGILLGFLAYFKYADFFIGNFNKLAGQDVPLLRIALPIGISFYTFQIISYVADVYRGEAKAQRNLINLAAYITMFPQLIAGPIVRYVDIAGDIEERTHSLENAAAGMRRFVLGLSKKVLLANVLGEFCELFKQSGDKSVLYYWVYAVAFSLQIYFDFSGYSDMAIGLGRVFGFHFCENFNYPFVSKSITEFWRRWHMSLGTWFRDYVYIPMGGNRVTRSRWLFNLLVVWALTGFWHGAAWNFVVWGLLFAVFLCIEKLVFVGKGSPPAAVGHFYTLLVVVLSFVIFNAADMGEAVQYLGGMFGFGSVPLVSRECLYYLKSYAVPLLLGVVGATPLVKTVAGKVDERPRNGLEPVVLLALLGLVTAFLVDGSFNPFLYFRF